MSTFHSSFPRGPRSGPRGSGLEPLRHHFGLEAFGVNAFVQPEAGARVIDDHRETGTRHQELYVVLRGRAEFALEGEPYDCPAGTCIAVRDPDVRDGISDINS
jgi:uncharacterized cupin superfamily protein